MSALSVLRFDDARVAVEEYYLAADKLISGNPKQSLWQHYTDATRQFFAGIWQSELGKWHIRYTEEEYCQILLGKSIITDADGNAVTVVAGDSLVLPRGFVGSWEVIELTRKIYVLYEPGS